MSDSKNFNLDKWREGENLRKHPSEFPPIEDTANRMPFTSNSSEYNTRDREVYCEECQYRVITKLIAPQCGNCKSYLIVVTKSVLADLGGQK